MWTEARSEVNRPGLSLNGRNISGGVYTPGLCPYGSETDLVSNRRIGRGVPPMLSPMLLLSFVVKGGVPKRTTETPGGVVVRGQVFVRFVLGVGMNLVCFVFYRKTS